MLTILPAISVRVAVFRSLDERFDAYLCQPDALQALARALTCLLPGHTCFRRRPYLLPCTTANRPFAKLRWRW